MRQRQAVAIPDVLLERRVKLRGRVRAAGRIARQNPTMAAGIVVMILMGLVALTAPLLASSDPQAIETVDRLLPPSAEHWFGTDHIGRDIYARTLYGGRVSLTIGFSVAFLIMTSGAVLGIVAGYFRRVDSVLMRVMDGLMAIPSILLAIALMTMLGGSIQNVVIALVIVETPRSARVVRASVLSLREQMFVEAARAIGARPLRIMVRHIFPNTIAPLLVLGTFTVASAIISEAYLSFLGAGVPPEIPTWGNIMALGKDYMFVAFYLIVIPGLFLMVTVLGVNLAGDGLRDILDPKLSRRG